jgi:hypothetical protein
MLFRSTRIGSNVENSRRQTSNRTEESYIQIISLMLLNINYKEREWMRCMALIICVLKSGDSSALAPRGEWEWLPTILNSVSTKWIYKIQESKSTLEREGRFKEAFSWRLQVIADPCWYCNLFSDRDRNGRAALPPHLITHAHQSRVSSASSAAVSARIVNPQAY